MPEKEQFEVKSFPFEGMELKASEEERGVVYGYAGVFGNLDRNGDILMPGSLPQKYLKVPLIMEHKSREVVGHAYLTEDSKGYLTRAVFAVDSESDKLRERALEAYAMMKEGHVDTFSFAFKVADADYEKKMVNGKPQVIRKIKKISDIGEVTITAIPANPLAKAFEVKSMQTDELKEIIAEAVRAALAEQQIPEMETKTEEQSQPQEPAMETKQAGQEDHPQKQGGFSMPDLTFEQFLLRKLTQGGMF